MSTGAVWAVARVGRRAGASAVWSGVVWVAARAAQTADETAAS